MPHKTIIGPAPGSRARINPRALYIRSLMAETGKTRSDAEALLDEAVKGARKEIIARERQRQRATSALRERSKNQ